MKEELLHYVWRLGRFDHAGLLTTQQTTLTVIKKGISNTNAGPDFLEAKVKIGPTTWMGSVEMHLRSSDWYRHQHHLDPAYKNVVLHVVLEEDEPVFHPSGERIPCLELKSRIEPKLKNRYQQLINQEHWIPCQPVFPNMASEKLEFWLQRLAIERLQDKTRAISHLLEQQKGDWEAMLFQVITLVLLGKVNQSAAERWAASLPIPLVRKYRHRLFLLEALFFGHAGLVAAEGEPYPNDLEREYTYLKKKHGLKPINGSCWKFMRMRPANFPTLRLAQLATLWHCNDHLFEKVLAASNLKEIENLFTVEVSQYWKTHFRFGKSSAPKNKRLGKQTLHLLAINAVAPLQFLYGQMRHRPELKDRAIQLWEETPGENNSVSRKWSTLGMHVESAFQSQALLHLKSKYCSQIRCLECQIGQTILSVDHPESVQSNQSAQSNRPMEKPK